MRLNLEQLEQSVRDCGPNYRVQWGRSRIVNLASPIADGWQSVCTQ